MHCRLQQTGIPGEFDESSRAVPYMPRAKQGIGRRPKKRRVSPASAIEVEQIEEEGVTEPVDVVIRIGAHFYFASYFLYSRTVG